MSLSDGSKSLLCRATFVASLRRFLAALLPGLLVCALAFPARAATVVVTVGDGGLMFSPADVTIQPGDTVMWTWSSSGHSTTSGVPGGPSGQVWNSGILNEGATFSHTFNQLGTFSYFCNPHGACCQMVGSVRVQNAQPAKLANISTRLRVEGGDNVPIAGFIVTGSVAKRVIARALGPSLNVGGVPVAGRVPDTTLELIGPSGQLAFNDNWRSTQEAEIIASTVPPPNDLESAVIATLPASSNGIAYTAVVRGAGNTTGVGQVELYDLDNPADAQLANISTRGLVQTGDDVMIGGIILLGNSPRRVIVRAIGPSLSVGGMPLPGRLLDPTLEVRDANGVLEGMNDNWRSDQEAEIIATTVPPSDDLESAIVGTLPASTGGTSHTAVVRGKNNTTGVALVEAFALP